jgi:hypothetical protein
MFYREEPRRFEIAGALGAIGNEFLAACVFDKSPKAKQDVAQMIANHLITWGVSNMPVRLRISQAV